MFYSAFDDQEFKVIPALCSLYFELISMENPNSDCNDFCVFVLLIITKKFVFVGVTSHTPRIYFS
jgi:hypothetical protein